MAVGDEDRELSWMSDNEVKHLSVCVRVKAHFGRED